MRRDLLGGMGLKWDQRQLFHHQHVEQRVLCEAVDIRL